MTDAVFEQLYYLSFSQESSDVVIPRILQTFCIALSLDGAALTQRVAGESKQITAYGKPISHHAQKYEVVNRFGNVIGELLIDLNTRGSFTPEQQRMVRAFINQLAHLLERLNPPHEEICFSEEVSKYKDLLVKDKLTGVFNRYHFEETIEELERENSYPLSVIIVDIDGLKIINDFLGHKYGDMAIIEAAELLKNTFRKGDFIARIGGDEFVILLPHTRYKLAEMRSKALLENLRAYNKTSNFPPLSYSIGVAETCGAETIRETLHKADLRMYEKKQRNALKYNHFLRTRCAAIREKEQLKLKHGTIALEV